MKLSDKELQAFRDSTVDEFPPSKLVSMAAELLAHRQQAEAARRSAEEAERLAKRSRDYGVPYGIVVAANVNMLGRFMAARMNRGAAN